MAAATINALLVVIALLPLAVTSHDCYCGVEGIRPMIHNGNEAMPGQYPWVVYVGFMILGRLRLTACAGTIINDRFILTSGHCVDPPTPQIVTTLAGLELGVWIGDGIRPADLRLLDAARVKGWVRHENYSTGEITTDVALIELQEPLTFHPAFSPICLPDFSDYDNLFAAGWGFIANPEMEPDSLMEADLAIVPDDLCHAIYNDLSDHEMCAGDEYGNVCPGDSGGPLMTRRGGRVYQAGITTAGTTTDGDDCGLTKNPGIFEKVSSHIDWIKEKSGPEAKWCRARFQAITSQQVNQSLLLSPDPLVIG